jgi:hypothetical protein
MAQTTTADNKAGFKVEVSTDASSFTDISGQGATVKVSGGDQLTGEQNTADGSAPVVTNANKVGSKTVEVSCLYDETAAHAWRLVKDRYDGAAKTICVRYSPRGGASAERRYVTANDAGTAIIVPIINCNEPEVDAGDGGPLMFTFSVITPKLLEEAVP